MIARRIVPGVLVVCAGLAAAVLVLLPPAAGQSPTAEWTYRWPVARGAFHIHSSRSDGTGSIDEIAEEAARIGLRFIVLTDHGDATRAPEPPSYRSGVLCIDGVEISTQGGHLVALGVPLMPYRLAGHPRDVIEDVHRAGGFGVAAHPGSPKAALQWGDWNAPFDGLEWLNADSEWRDELWGSLGRVLLTYPFRPVETLAMLLDRPDAVLAQWDRLARERRVFGIAGADAHARLGFRQSSDPYQDRVLARVPAYTVSFRAFINHVVLDGPLTGDAAVDAANVLAAIREGRVFTSVDGLASTGGFEVAATSGTAIARIGEYLDPQGPVVIHAQVMAPEGTTLVVLRDGKPLYERAASSIRVDIGTEPGAYRVEAHLPRAAQRQSVPWILANPIYVGLRTVHAAQPPPTVRAVSSRRGVATNEWRAEASPGSVSELSAGTLDDGTPAVVWRFRLAEGPAASQFAAIWFPVGQGLAADERLQLRVRADRPVRVWVQLRASAARGEERWVKSFYAGPSLDPIDLRFAEFRPADPTASERPPLGQIDSLLLVVDTVNTAPGTRGTISIPDLWVVR